MKDLSKKIGIFLVALVLIILLSNVVNRFILPSIPFLPKPVIFFSTNMAPTYEKYDVLFYSEAEDYNVNDTILFSIPSAPNLVTRIIKINEDGTFYAKADNNPFSLPFETSINKNQIIGKIVFSIKPFIFYPLIYSIYIIIALLLTVLIYSRLAWFCKIWQLIRRILWE